MNSLFTVKNIKLFFKDLTLIIFLLVLQQLKFEFMDMLMNISNVTKSKFQDWKVDQEIFLHWLMDKQQALTPALNPEPTIKVLIFLALLEADRACTYADIKEIFREKKILQGLVPDNTLRTSMLSLGKTLDKFDHNLELKALRGRFQLTQRTLSSAKNITKEECSPIVLVLDRPTIKAEDIARELVEKARLPFHSLYFLEWSARWWQIFSHSEAEIRLKYEASAWESLGINKRLFANDSDIISFVSMAPGEGLAEIELLRKILKEDSRKKIHYMAIDSSQRLLREHINLLKETLAVDFENNRIICIGVIANVFDNLQATFSRVRKELVIRDVITQEDYFIPSSSSLLVTYFGNCLGNHYQDHEIEIFSIVRSVFSNRPLEFLVGVSIMRATPDVYKRNWDEFLLQTPKHLLEINNFLESNSLFSDNSLPEFSLPKDGDSERCPAVIPEAYIVRHGIRGQIYRFYYKLAYDLKLSSNVDRNFKYLPKGTLILLYNIVKYDIISLVSGIETSGLFKVAYDKNFHQIVDTPNGIREYAVFSAYLN